MSYFPDMAYLAVREVLKAADLRPSQQYFQGVCLVADISGFTKLCGQMCKDGLSGLDSLHTFLNTYMSMIMSVVYLHKGDGNI